MRSSHFQALAFISATPRTRSKVRECLERYWSGDFRVASSLSSKRLDIFDFEYLILDFDEGFFSSQEDLLRQLNKAKIAIYLFADEKAEEALRHLIKNHSSKVSFVYKSAGMHTDFCLEELVKLIEKVNLSCSTKFELDLLKGKLPRPELIAIGASTGGPEAINTLTKKLSCEMPPILIVLHMKANLIGAFCKRLQSLTHLKVVEIKSPVQIAANSIFIASGDSHMIVKKKGILLFAEPGKKNKVNGHCPSVDILFDSICAIHDLTKMGILLTGMGIDGALGLLNLKKSGALTVVQDESSSAVYGMPKAAVDLDATNYILSLDELTQLLQYFSLQR